MCLHLFPWQLDSAELAPDGRLGALLEVSEPFLQRVQHLPTVERAQCLLTQTFVHVAYIFIECHFLAVSATFCVFACHDGFISVVEQYAHHGLRLAGFAALRARTVFLLAPGCETVRTHDSRLALVTHDWLVSEIHADAALLLSWH